MRDLKFRAWDGKQFIPVCINAGGKPCIIVYPGQQIIQDNCQQFTGLQDKNGKDIYEGDVVKWGHAREWSRENPVRIAEVKINPDIQFHSQVGVFKFGNFAYADSIDKDLEVIGNVFENVDLLK